jgi:hypothetical protein
MKAGFETVHDVAYTDCQTRREEHRVQEQEEVQQKDVNPNSEMRALYVAQCRLVKNLTKTIETFWSWGRFPKS